MLTVWVAWLFAAPPVSLSIDGPTDGCVDRAALVARVAERLRRPAGDMVFSNDGARRITVTITRRGREVMATIALTEPDGRVGERVLRAHDCEALLASVALALALAVDPLGDGPEPPDPARPMIRIARARAPEEPTATARREPEAPPPTPRPSAPFALGFGVAAWLGVTPEVALGPALRVTYGDRWRAVVDLGLGLAGASTLGAGTPVGAVTRVEVRAAACLDDRLGACLGLAWARSFVATGGESAARDQLALELAAVVRPSPRARFELALGVPLLAPTTFTGGGIVLWQAPPVGATFRLVVSP